MRGVLEKMRSFE